MSTLLDVAALMAIAGGLVATVVTLIRLTAGDAARRKAKPGVRAAAWRFLCYSAGLTLIGAAQLMNGPAVWVLLGVSLCLVSFALIWHVRLLLRLASRA